MGYYIRVLGTIDPDIHIDELIDSLSSDRLTAKIEYDPSEQPGKWSMIDVLNDKNEPLVQIERNPVIDGELGKEELEEFKDQIQDCKPASAVEWLMNYFENVKVIYAFQMLNASFEDGNFEIVTSIKTKIWNRTNGILQADDEGFSNEYGYHILWQFRDNVTGKWSCAIRSEKGDWDNFVMDLGNKNQRDEFQNGKVPQKAKRI